MKSKQACIDAIIEYFEDNEDVFNDCIEELDNYNGFLGDDRYYPMEELDELYNGEDALEILQRAFYGYDEDTYNMDSSGNKTYGPFCPNRDFFKFNGYGNLVSTDYKNYGYKIDHWAVESMAENRMEIQTIDNYEELTELFDEYEEAEEE